ncbi:hypothetical protein [Vibrio vulnificus]|uniref:hypothetical protein n=1 Tax=Vibrio vulnificus TaxID=672 RepID=UPI000C9E0D35|nr:hypothetical protein [Vibrio vulnificus]MBE3919251.1 hypothetical protein [Vibrio parahaemolyticus]EGR1514551.1 hypothetical protein [Vibrio vulnificus]ELU4011261.1 hypothetical protein [Vibrio vulnificus]MBE4190920.1 hypothetical protein [Vibrio parahaemolyticus]POC10582.1 hypothetical protein CRN54_10470 [Vibrio vulnificus]
MKKTINNGNDEVIVNIEVDEINTLETLTKLADAYVDISSRIDEYRADIDWNCPIEINVVTPEGSVSEEEMFMKFTSDPTLERRAVTFIYNIINYCKTTTLELWGGDEDHLAEPGAYALCMYHEKYIPLYIELLLQNDLDHEVYQSGHIIDIIEKYGFTSDVLRLMANRVDAAAGQHGSEDMKEYYPQLMELFLNQPEQKFLFLNTAVQSIYLRSIPYSLPFDSIRDLSIYIQESDERTRWLKQQEEQAKGTFGKNVRW